MKKEKKNTFVFVRGCVYHFGQVSVFIRHQNNKQAQEAATEVCPGTEDILSHHSNVRKQTSTPAPGSETRAPTSTCIPESKHVVLWFLNALFWGGRMKERKKTTKPDKCQTISCGLCALGCAHLQNITPPQPLRTSPDSHYADARTHTHTPSRSISLPLHTTALPTNGGRQNNQTDQLQCHDYNNS